MKHIYLDYAAATPMEPSVLRAMKPYFTEKFYNPSATYQAGRQIRQELNDARASIARLIGARPGEIYFTAGATEANNLAISGIIKQYPGSEVLVSAIEHDSIIAPSQQHKNKIISVDKKGIVDLSVLKKLIGKNTVLISVMLVNNELGTIQPLREIAEIIKEVRKERLKERNKMPLFFHTDAAQAGNYLDLHSSRLGVDMMSINGGKIYGPKQSGALYVRAGVLLQPLILGGGQEAGLRSGTENVTSIIGLACALGLSQEKRNFELNRVKTLNDIFTSELTRQIPSIIINGSPKHQAPHILHVSFPGFDNERIMMELDERGVQAAVGSACSAASTEPSHVLRAIGMDDNIARSSLRFSMGRDTSKKDIIKTVKILKGIIAA